MSDDASATGRLFILLRPEREASGINRIYQLYRDEGLTVRTPSHHNIQPRVSSHRRVDCHLCRMLGR